MKAAVYLGGPKNIAIQTLPDPVIHEGGALVKIEACHICGVDLRTYAYGDEKITPPRILGHEFSGTVVELKSDVAGVTVGDRVAMYIVLPCGTCVYCKQGKANLCDERTAMAYQHDGGFAEYMVVPRQAVENHQLVRIPDHVDFEAAALAEPLGCVLHAHGRLHIGSEDTVAIIGAGPIGLFHALVSKIEGARHVCLMDVSETRLKLAEEFGFDSYVLVAEGADHIQKAKALNDGLGPEVVIVAVGVAQAQADAVEMAGKAARLEFFGGLPKSTPYAALNTNLIHYRELTVSGSYSQTTEDFMAALKLIVSGSFPTQRIITHRFELADLLKAFQVSQRGQAIKVSIRPGL